MGSPIKQDDTNATSNGNGNGTIVANGNNNNNNNNSNPADPAKAPTVMETVQINKLVDRCLNLLEHSQNANHDASNCHNFNCYKQIFVGVAGTPGSGKSFIAEQVSKRLNERNPNGDPNKHECVVIGMDGYHLTRKQLKEKAEAGELFQIDEDQLEEEDWKEVVKKDEDKKVVYKEMTYKQLMQRRGAPFTYCRDRFIQDLRKIKQEGEGWFPKYDRAKHDPVSNAVRVERHHKVILVEGLYLLCLNDPDWKPLDELWDDKWYIEVSLEETKRRLIKRDLKNWNDEKASQWGGHDEKAAAKKAEFNDMKNANCIKRESKGQANLIVVNEHIPGEDDD